MIFNEGRNQGALFHGNFAGDYLPNANSKYVLPLEFSSISSVDEIEVSMNWDLQGYLDDYITVELSIDNGTSGIHFLADLESQVLEYGIMGTCIMENQKVGYRYFLT